MVRTRIAPSPTGIPHIGNTRTALYNYLFAKHNGGEFILRIEDTDQARKVEGAEEKILEILKWLELRWDGEVIKQSDRLQVYKDHAFLLREKGIAYEDNGAIRFKMPKEGITSWTDGVGNKEISFENKNQEDFVILKSDGYPTYNFANVIDDYQMKISHVIRGDEFISSTPKHIQLYKAFDWQHPVFVHLPVIVGSDHQKLSKRHGAKSVLDYRDEGYLKEAIINYMALLGWNPGGDKEIMSISEMTDLFDLGGINTASSVFDPKKLEWINGEYIRQLNINELSEKLKEQSSNFGNNDEFEKFVGLAQTRMKTLNEFENLILPFIHSVKKNLTEEEKNVEKKLAEKLSGLTNWDVQNILEAIKEVLKSEDTNMKTIYKIAIGAPSGLPIADAFTIVGREKTLALLN